MEELRNKNKSQLKETKMKKYLLFITLICSSSCFAFPAYDIVNCRGIINGHRTSWEFNRVSHLLKFTVDRNQGVTYANEDGNRIYTDADYDEDGDALVIEILSNSDDWNATLNLYINDQIALSSAISCQKVGMKVAAEKHTSLANVMSSLQVAK